jgi:hypothetical protein
LFYFLTVCLDVWKRLGYIGCGIGNSFEGNLQLVYTDDLTQIATSATAVRMMIDICNCYGSENSITFDADKTKCVVLRPTTRAEDFELPQRLQTRNPLISLLASPGQYYRAQSTGIRMCLIKTT